jgi:hypothetical protein
MPAERRQLTTVLFLCSHKLGEDLFPFRRSSDKEDAPEQRIARDFSPTTPSFFMCASRSAARNSSILAQGSRV